MPYQNIPETGLDASIAKLIGRLRVTFNETISNNLDDIERLFVEGCPSPLERRELLQKLNNIKETSTNVSDRLSRFKKLPTPLKNVSRTVKAGVGALKAIPFPPFFPGGLVADALTLIKEIAVQLQTSAESIENALSQALDVESLQQRAANIAEKVDTALELCSLAAENNTSLDPTLLNDLVSGTPTESSRALRLLNSEVDRASLNSNTSTTLSLDTPIETELYSGPDETVYVIKIVEVPSDFTRAPRRQAIAENQEGVKKFESDKSFSSSVEILKQQVKFRIDISQV